MGHLSRIIAYSMCHLYNNSAFASSITRTCEAALGYAPLGAPCRNVVERNGASFSRDTRQQATFKRICEVGRTIRLNATRARGFALLGSRSYSVLGPLQAE